MAGATNTSQATRRGHIAVTVKQHQPSENHFSWDWLYHASCRASRSFLRGSFFRILSNKDWTPNNSLHRARQFLSTKYSLDLSTAQCLVLKQCFCKHIQLFTATLEKRFGARVGV